MVSHINLPTSSSKPSHTHTHKEDTINPNHFNQNNNRKNPSQFLTGLIPKDLARNLCVRGIQSHEKPIQLGVAN